MYLLTKVNEWYYLYTRIVWQQYCEGKFYRIWRDYVITKDHSASSFLVSYSTSDGYHETRVKSQNFTKNIFTRGTIKYVPYPSLKTGSSVETSNFPPSFTSHKFQPGNVSIDFALNPTFSFCLPYNHPITENGLIQTIAHGSKTSAHQISPE